VAPVRWVEWAVWAATWAISEGKNHPTHHHTFLPRPFPPGSKPTPRRTGRSSHATGQRFPFQKRVGPFHLQKLQVHALSGSPARGHSLCHALGEERWRATCPLSPWILPFRALVRADAAALAEVVIDREVFADRSLGTVHRAEPAGIALLPVDQGTENAPGPGLPAGTGHRAADGEAAALTHAASSL